MLVINCGITGGCCFHVITTSLPLQKLPEGSLGRFHVVVCSRQVFSSFFPVGALCFPFISPFFASFWYCCPTGCSRQLGQGFDLSSQSWESVVSVVRHPFKGFVCRFVRIQTMYPDALSFAFCIGITVIGVIIVTNVQDRKTNNQFLKMAVTSNQSRNKVFEVQKRLHIILHIYSFLQIYTSKYRKIWYLFHAPTFAAMPRRVLPCSCVAMAKKKRMLGRTGPRPSSGVSDLHGAPFTSYFV